MGAWVFDGARRVCSLGRSTRGRARKLAVAGSCLMANHRCRDTSPDHAEDQSINLYDMAYPKPVLSGTRLIHLGSITTYRLHIILRCIIDAACNNSASLCLDPKLFDMPSVIPREKPFELNLLRAVEQSTQWLV